MIAPGVSIVHRPASTRKGGFVSSRRSSIFRRAWLHPTQPALQQRRDNPDICQPYALRGRATFALRRVRQGC